MIELMIAHFPVAPACHVVAFSEDGSLGEGGCSMKITEDVRKYAAKQGISENAAIKKGLEEKAAETGDLYQKV
jgi:hypothetical protein